MKRILVQLDPDTHASLFDAVVAIDSEVDQLLQYSQVEPAAVRDLVHGAMFTRGVDDLKRTAVFIGGADVQQGEALLAAVTGTFFGPMRVSVMLDSNGANTTAAAAVMSASKHGDLAGAQATVLAATGPVGQRVVKLLGANGTKVRVCSRDSDRARRVIDSACVSDGVDPTTMEPWVTAREEQISAALEGAELVFACGAAGIQLVGANQWQNNSSLRVAVDLNAVEPHGIEGIAVTAKAEAINETICYGAIGVGGTKMKIHKAAIRQLFQANDQVFDAMEIYALGQQLL